MRTPALPTVAKRLLNSTAADLMTPHMTTIPAEMSLREAARLLFCSKISGAPVADAQGNCLGILSTSDFVHWAGTADVAQDPNVPTSFIAPWGEVINLDACDGNEVRRYMTARFVTVDPDTRIAEIAQRMVNAHIHRVLVARDGEPCGIVTSTDVMAAVAKAAQ
jgi:predicted transcriptional regulator